MENITQVASNTATIQAFQDTVDNMMTVVIVLILSAGLLAFVVLYNLTNINIGERVREIATLKVLGFTRREVDLYVFRENLWLSLFGHSGGICIRQIPAPIHHEQRGGGDDPALAAKFCR